MMLRDLATAWLRANCPLPKVQSNFLEHLDDAVQSDVSCSLLVGPELVKTARPFLVSCFRGEFFVFELTKQQATQLEVADNMLLYAKSKSPQPHQRTADPVITLESIEVDHGNALDASSPITGSVGYQTSKILLEPLTIRMVCDPPGMPGITLYHHLCSLPFHAGSAKFAMSSLDDLRDDQGTAFKGVVPLFFQIWTSNARPLMPDLNGPTPTPIDGWKPKPPQPLGPGGWDAAWQHDPIASSQYSIPFDTKPTTASAAVQGQPISDVRAVLVEIALQTGLSPIARFN